VLSTLLHLLLLLLLQFRLRLLPKSGQDVTEGDQAGDGEEHVEGTQEWRLAGRVLKGRGPGEWSHGALSGARNAEDVKHKHVMRKPSRPGGRQNWISAKRKGKGCPRLSA
jgi:hypothetical protein